MDADESKKRINMLIEALESAGRILDSIDRNRPYIEKALRKARLSGFPGGGYDIGAERVRAALKQVEAWRAKDDPPVCMVSTPKDAD